MALPPIDTDISASLGYPDNGKSQPSGRSAVSNSAQRRGLHVKSVRSWPYTKGHDETYNSRAWEQVHANASERRHFGVQPTDGREVVHLGHDELLQMKELDRSAGSGRYICRFICEAQFGYIEKPDHLRFSSFDIRAVVQDAFELEDMGSETLQMTLSTQYHRGGISKGLQKAINTSTREKKRAQRARL